MSVAKACPIYGCNRRVEFRVRFAHAKLGTEAYARVCRKHSTEKHFPASWGKLIRVENLSEDLRRRPSKIA